MDFFSILTCYLQEYIIMEYNKNMMDDVFRLLNCLSEKLRMDMLNYF